MEIDDNTAMDGDDGMAQASSTPCQHLFCVEHLIEGDYVKYNSNSGFVANDEVRHGQVAQQRCFLGAGCESQLAGCAMSWYMYMDYQRWFNDE